MHKSWKFCKKSLQGPGITVLFTVYLQVINAHATPAGRVKSRSSTTNQKPEFKCKPPIRLQISDVMIWLVYDMQVAISDWLSFINHFTARSFHSFWKSSNRNAKTRIYWIELMPKTVRNRNVVVCCHVTLAYFIKEK